jgi:hypothetical protein
MPDELTTSSWKQCELGLRQVAWPELLLSGTDPRVHYAGEEFDIEFDPFRIAIGDRPLGLDLGELYRRSKRELPALYQEFAVSNRIWMISYAVGVIEEGRGRELTDLGLRVSFPSASRIRASIIDVLPQTRFVTKLKASLECKADVRLDGHLEMPDAAVALLADTIPAGFDSKLTLATHADLVGRTSFSVMTSVIQSIGVASSASEWLLHKDGVPLVGTHIFKQTVILPKNVQSVTVKATVYAVVGGFFRAPVRLQGEEVDLPCRLS